MNPTEQKAQPFTAGPWRASWNGHWLIQTVGGWLVAKVMPPKPSGRGQFSPENVEANARLIAAAPCQHAELLKVEQLLAAYVNHEDVDMCAVAERLEAVRDILSKATTKPGQTGQGE
jgi:hypothetical protein